MLNPRGASMADVYVHVERYAIRRQEMLRPKKKKPEIPITLPTLNYPANLFHILIFMQIYANFYLIMLIYANFYANF